MIDRTNDKRYELNVVTSFMKREFESIRENWLLFLLCFFISRYSIIGKIFPFAIIILCMYCYMKGPSISVLTLSVLSILTVRFDFVYIVMLIAICMFFYSVKYDEKKNIIMISAYAAAVLFCSKTSILIIKGFNVDEFMLNTFEAIFIFSSIILIKEAIEIFENIKRKGTKDYIHRHNMKKSKENISSERQEKLTAVNEAAPSAVTSENVQKTHIGFHDKKEKMSEKRKLINIFSDKAKDKIKEQLLWEGINLKFFEVIPGNNEVIFISATVRTEKSPEKAEEAIVLTVRNLCGVKLKCTEKISASSNYYILKFRNIKRVRIKTYSALATKEGSTMSGDSFTYAGRADKYYAVLCDGIGSGEEAFKESNDTVNMLSRFFYTDFSEEQILKTLNSLLMLKFDKDRYVTFDMQIIDYVTKEIRLYKAGTPPTFIVSGKNVEKIEGHSLPMGILENFEYNSFKSDIKRGDIIIMISDGIIDSINMDEKKSLEKYLDLIVDKDPQTIANLILSYALRGQKEVIDDMTVLVTKIG